MNEQPRAAEYPSQVRHRIISVSVLMAFTLYVDRLCLAEIFKSELFLNDVSLSRNEMGDILGAFFWAYALMQVPSGWVSDRFGARRMLTFYIFAWSAFTGLTGLMSTATGFFLARVGVGIAQAGAYPTSSGVIRRWFPLRQRGRASSLVSLGGRIGGTVATGLTTLMLGLLSGWRPTLWIYCCFGWGVAFLYWWIVRDRPEEHPDCNHSEREQIGVPVDGQPVQFHEILRMLGSFCRHRGLWMNSLVQFCINVGWAYLVTWLPTYLKESGGVSDRQGALMMTIVMSSGMFGQVFGGWLTDYSARRFGLRYGRGVPVFLACFTAGTAYVSCPMISNIWGIVACCCVVSLMTDVGNPSSWAFMQDIGGKSTSAVYGWGNMWGNFGAAFIAILVPRLLSWGESAGYGNQPVFFVCGGAFFLAAFAALAMDATRQVTA